MQFSCNEHYTNTRSISNMTGLSNQLESDILEYIFRDASIFSKPGTIYIALLTGDPDDGDSIATYEPSGGSYSRPSIGTTNSTWTAVSGGNTRSEVVVTFPTPTASWGVITHFAIMTHVTAQGGTYCLFTGEIAPSIDLTTGPWSAPIFLNGSISVTLR